jgi:hypothetical protein
MPAVLRCAVTSTPAYEHCHTSGVVFANRHTVLPLEKKEILKEFVKEVNKRHMEKRFSVSLLRVMGRTCSSKLLTGCPYGKGSLGRQKELPYLTTLFTAEIPRMCTCVDEYAVPGGDD